MEEVKRGRKRKHDTTRMKTNINNRKKMETKKKLSEWRRNDTTIFFLYTKTRNNTNKQTNITTTTTTKTKTTTTTTTITTNS